MKVKVYVDNGYRIINVNVLDSLKTISELFERWEYIEEGA